MADVIKGQAYVVASMYDAGHLTEERIEEIKRTTQPHLIPAVVYGDPTMGAGNVYQVPRKEIEYDHFRDSKGKILQIPAYWKLIGGLDVGKYTAFVKLAYDTDTDTIYVTDEYFTQGLTPPSVIASAIRHRKGDKFPIMIDPASNGRNAIDGRQLIVEYRKEKLDCRPADNTVEAGIHACWERFSTGRLKIFKHCTNLLKEYELYQRDIGGKVVKKNDHGMDALRYGVMGIKQAKLMYRKEEDHSYTQPYVFGNY